MRTPRRVRSARPEVGPLRDALRHAIQDGRLRAGTVLPSSRQLATDLGVSRGVVTDAYEQLAPVTEFALRLMPVQAMPVKAAA